MRRLRGGMDNQFNGAAMPFENVHDLITLANIGVILYELRAVSIPQSGQAAHDRCAKECLPHIIIEADNPITAVGIVIYRLTADQPACAGYQHCTLRHL